MYKERDKSVYCRYVKRALDFIFSLTLLFFLLLPVFLISVAIRCDSDGAAIFKQKRIGRGGKAFICYKFRTMYKSAPPQMPSADFCERDKYITRIGRFLRRTSLDELPQLFNVLKGDMSLVGPRPEIPFYVDSFKHSIPMYMIKHQVKPGMTGLAQVNGYRGDTSIKKRIEYDIEYIENWNIFLDISILIRTVFAGFVNKEKLRTTENELGETTDEQTEITN